MPAEEGQTQQETAPDDDTKRTSRERTKSDERALERKQRVMKAEYRGREVEPVTMDELWRLGELGKGASRPMSAPAEHKANLPTVMVTIGRLTVEAIIDTGSMVNMISAEQAEKARMPTGPLDKDAFQLGGILGPTVGALFILDGGSFDVILGMPLDGRVEGKTTRS